jgi:hypothetical protein
MEEHHIEKLKHVVHEESLFDLGPKTNMEDQISNLLLCCLRLLNDLDVAKKLMQVLATCIGKELTMRTISSSLPERVLF